MERLPLVVVGGNGQQRCPQAAEHVQGNGMFCRITLVGQVTREQRQVRPRIEPVHLGNFVREQGIGIRRALIENPGSAQVGIKELGDQHPMPSAARDALPYSGQPAEHRPQRQQDGRTSGGRSGWLSASNG
jgi:hypothetical protein